MATEITPELLTMIEQVLRRKANGATLEELVHSFEQPPAKSDMRQWLRALIEEGRAEVVGRGETAVYRASAFAKATADTSTFSTAEADRSASATPTADSPATAEPTGGTAANAEVDAGSGDAAEGVRERNGAGAAADVPGAGTDVVEQQPATGSAEDSQGGAQAPSGNGAGSTVARAEAAGLTPGLAAADEARYAALFDLCVFPMVAGMMPRLSATGYLQTQGRLFLETQDERATFVGYGLRRMEALTADDAARYGLTTEQMAAWQQAYEPNALSGGPAGGSIGSTVATAAVMRPPGATPQRWSAGRRSGRPSAGGAGGAPAGNQAIVTPVATARSVDLQTEVRTVAQGLAAEMAREMVTTWDVRAAVRRAGAAMKATLSPGRALTAVVWACAVFVGVQYYLKIAATQVTAGGAQRFALIGQALGYATVPLCGAVWLGFRWWDLRKGDGLKSVDVVVTLLVGGVLGLMLANVVVSLGSCMSGLLPK